MSVGRDVSTESEMWDDVDPDAVARLEAEIEREFLESLGPLLQQPRRET
ncbi:hypothetical protein [Leifsonia sp. Leaf336]|nr:hypothetical protein [Leifsonia sp. Leaf336]